MKSLLALILLLSCIRLAAQTPQSVTVQVHATAQTAPPSITLHWPADANANSYTIYRKARTAVGWGSLLGSVPGTDTTFVDATAQVGEAWEYRITKSATGYNGNGYCFAGIARPEQDYFGKLILVVDTTHATALAPELSRLTEDLWGDGWQVVRLNVDRNDLVPDIKARIQNIWMADPVYTRSVFLLGHVPVPYSGNLNPDGHGDHQGAWPADVYYGEMNGNWTDQTVNNSSAARPQNRNTIGDGKFDNTTIPGDVELEVGRVDFANMPAFGVGEQALLRRYLEKDHDWRMKAFAVTDSGVVDDNFGYFGGEAFATSGWRNMAPLIGSRHSYAGDFRMDLNARDHLWAYGCGGGWYQGASGVGATSDFAGDSLRGVFTMIFGSYHGDWDSDDNFLRAALASKGHILSTAWAGRPNWHFQHMGLGEPIGYAARTTQNNFSTYLTGFGARYVHIALMGDPSIRMHVCAPPSDLVVTLANGGNAHELNWTPSPDAVLGYAIYRQDTLDGRFWRIGQVGLNTATYTDSCMMPGDYRYMVRAEEVRTGYSGSYHNLSQGIFDTISNASVYAVQAGVFSPQVFCPGDTVQVPFTTVNDFCAGNVFTAELSDSTGSFVQAAVMGTVNAFGSGTVVCVIPPNAIPATGYRIRVNGSNPATIGLDNGADLEILGMPVASFGYSQSNLSFQFTGNSSGATSTIWSFGDGNTSTLPSPSHTYATGGNYTVQLIAGNACGSDTAEVNLTLMGMEEADGFRISIHPNPAGSWFEIWSDQPLAGIQSIRVIDGLGHEVYGSPLLDPRLRIETSHWSRGLYIVEIQSKLGIVRRKIVLE